MPVCLCAFAGADLAHAELIKPVRGTVKGYHARIHGLPDGVYFLKALIDSLLDHIITSLGKPDARQAAKAQCFEQGDGLYHVNCHTCRPRIIRLLHGIYDRAFGAVFGFHPLAQLGRRCHVVFRIDGKKELAGHHAGNGIHDLNPRYETGHRAPCLGHVQGC